MFPDGLKRLPPAGILRSAERRPVRTLNPSHAYKKPHQPTAGTVSSMAEGVGFEPTRPFGQTVFKTASL